jgi:hypothetical protein
VDRVQLGDVDLDHVGEEFIEVAIRLRIDARRAARIVQVRRRGQRRLHRSAARMLQRERDFVRRDRSGAAHFFQRDRRCADLRLVARVVALQVDVADRRRAPESRDLRDEPEPPRFAPEFAVGDRAHADGLLPADDLRDLLVF